MAEREVIRINEDLCDGCGKCVPSCAEGALKVVGGKAKLISEVYCDGLGACLGNCPKGALEVISREAEPFDSEEVLQHLSVGELNNDVIVSCPGTENLLEKKTAGKLTENSNTSGEDGDAGSKLKNWPVQINLVPTKARYFKNCDLLISADCVAFSFPEFHERILRGKILLVGCPKLDNHDFYLEKLSELFVQNRIKSITVAYMEVPCCFGMVHLVKEAIRNSQKEMNLRTIKLSIGGELLQEDAETIGGDNG